MVWNSYWFKTMPFMWTERAWKDHAHVYTVPVGRKVLGLVYGVMYHTTCATIMRYNRISEDGESAVTPFPGFVRFLSHDFIVILIYFLLIIINIPKHNPHQVFIFINLF